VSWRRTLLWWWSMFVMFLHWLWCWFHWSVAFMSQLDRIGKNRKLTNGRSLQNNW
jgi:hypothetical protein